MEIDSDFGFGSEFVQVSLAEVVDSDQHFVTSFSKEMESNFGSETVPPLHILYKIVRNFLFFHIVDNPKTNYPNFPKVFLSNQRKIQKIKAIITQKYIFYICIYSLTA